ncbi:glycosyltransferase family 4 protein [Thioalkalivibrio versutus]|uniref:glycosyltransferase family 4 protein n=1 Tax=Thioalkalivibrio versutus TaxID=106634 RepID=UPI0004782F45|nr:glycosyltransferase family 4 protein [Thioalkalivibrio versutus]OOC47842.1 glycosyl transferase [Thioalkalivibrio versutus]
MRTIILNHSDLTGGAARAAYRIHKNLRLQGVDSRMAVNKAVAGDWSVDGPESVRAKVLAMLRGPIGNLSRRTLQTENPIVHSPAILPSSWRRRLNTSDADVIHMHWVAGEMLSIKDIGHIRKPVVWTLHDMWAFCGAEHYTEDHRWRDGYHRHNRPAHESGFDLNRWTWKRKRKHWQRPMHIVTPSRWLADCARESQLMQDWPVSVVPNVINTDVWRPVDQRMARDLLGLPQDVPLLLFGAMGGSRDPRKGFDLLLEALSHLRGEVEGLELVVFGQLSPREPPDLGFPIHYTGHLHDDVSLRVLYSAADLLAIPSRQDNLPNTGVESLACGTPVIAFDTCGLPDIVSHRENGYLAKAFDAADFAEGVRWVMQHKPADTLRLAARQSAVDCFSPGVVVPQYLEVYRQAIEMQGS